MLYEFLGKKPVVNESNFIAPDADVIGDVTLGQETSVWFHTTIRADVNRIRIGDRTNIQDNTCIHVMNRTGPTIIGNEVTVGHGAMIHGCTIRDRVLVGIKAVILDKAVIESDCIVAAGSLVPPGKTMPSGYLCMGIPAKPVRRLTGEELESIKDHAHNYVKYSRAYLLKDKYDSNPFYDAGE